MQTKSMASQKYLSFGNILLYLLIGCCIFVFISLIIAGFFQLFNIGCIYPGVSVNGIPVGGMTKEAAIEKITAEFTYPSSGKLLLASPEGSWAATPGELGLYFDPEDTISNAFQIGRHGDPFTRIQALLHGSTISPSMIFDQRTAAQYLTNLADSIDQFKVEPSLYIENGQVITTTGQPGKYLDINDVFDKLSRQFETTQDGIIELSIKDIQPDIQDVNTTANAATMIIGEPLSITIPEEPGVWSIDQTSLAQLLSFAINSEAKSYDVVINVQLLKQYLYSLEDEINVSPSSTRFIFNDDTRQLEVIQPAVIGRNLNVDNTVLEIQNNLLAGSHNAQFQFDYITPPITDDFNGDQLGITELIHEETSYFYGSSTERVQNITTATKQFHGLLIPPGETFSMVDALGDISLDNGYAEALIIYGDETIKGVGGGVCQVSTTLFRAAFFAGFPIVERHAHAYRVYYYEKVAGNRIDSNLAGLDATVYAPYVDLKFTNDSPYWILMETYVNPTYSSLVWKFYSTGDGRTVEWDPSGLQNVEEAPKPLYRENPDLSSGEVRQVDWEAEGADITVTRRVYRDGAIINSDTFITNYEPWQAVYEYGPGTEGMPPEDSNGQEETD